MQKLDWCKNPENKHGNNNTNVMIVDAIIVMNYKVKIVLMTYNNMIVKKNILLTILLCLLYPKNQALVIHKGLLLLAYNTNKT